MEISHPMTGFKYEIEKYKDRYKGLESLDPFLAIKPLING